MCRVNEIVPRKRVFWKFARMAPAIWDPSGDAVAGAYCVMPDKTFLVKLRSEDLSKCKRPRSRCRVTIWYSWR